MSEKQPGSDSNKPKISLEVRMDSWKGELSAEQGAEKIAELEALYEAFEQRHDLEKLRAIQVHSVEEALANTDRQAAKADLPLLVSRINFLENNIPDELFLTLLARHKIIMAAVGAFNNGQLDHSVREGWIKL
jgi:aryl-alcohol dehydrogenase-like predicted oxidoreductase